MSGKQIQRILAMACALLSAASLLLLDQLRGLAVDVAEAEARRTQSFRLADELRQSSDDLTRMARTFAVTGNERFAEWFQRILDIRNGDAPRPVDYDSIYWDFVTATGEPPRPDAEAVPLVELMRSAGFQQDELAMLREAQVKSDALVALEERAMQAVRGHFQDETGRYDRTGEPDLALARGLLHGPEYHRAKADILKPLDELFRKVDERTAAEVSVLRREEELFGRTSMAFLAIAALLALLVAWLGRREAGAAPGSPAFARRPAGSLDNAWPLMASSCCACGLAFVLAWWVQARIGDRARAELGSSLQTVLETTASAVQGWLDEHESEAAVWADQPDVRDALLLLIDPAASDDARHAAQAALARRLEPMIALKGIDSYSLIDTGGRVLASSQPDRLGGQLARARAVLDRLLASERRALVELPREDPQREQRATMLAAALVTGADDEALGAIVLDIDPEKEFTEILQRGRLGESGESYGFNRAGQLVSESRFDDDLRAIGLISEGERGILKVDVRDPGGNMVAGFQPAAGGAALPLTRMAAAAVAGRPGLDLEGYADYRGVPVIGAWTWDETHELGIATEMDVAEGYAQLRRVRRVTYGAAGATSVLVLALTVLFLRSRRTMVAAQAELSSSEERTRTMMESATDAIICLDENERVLMWNAGAEAMFGRSAQEMLGEPVTAIVPEPWREKHAAGWRAMRQSGGLLTRTAGRATRLEGLRADGSTFPIELSLGIGKAEGSMLVTAFIRDVSERVQMEEEIHAARRAAEQANQAKSAFLANMSHELRTPMNAILGYSEMLAEECEEDGNEQYLSDLGKIQTAGKHLLSLINDVLDLSKIEAGRMSVFEEDFSVVELINDVITTTAPLIAKNGNRIERDLADDLGFAHADLTKLRQALFNLLSNASKFTKGGVVTIRGRREARAGKAWFVFSVSDTGIGIPADKFDHIFEEFAQADDSTTRQYGGTGLGLPLSRRLCRLMGGELSVTSEAGVGSTFTIEIPAGVPAAAEATAPEPKAPPGTEAEAEAGPLVLVVDDEADARELVRRTLESEGYRVKEARTGAEALEAARRLQPDLITLDVMMPGMDGWAALRRLKADPELQATPVVMLSIVADRELSLSLGAVEAMPKPIDRDELRRLTARLVNRQGEGRTALVVEDDPPTRELLCRNLRDEGWTVDTAENGAIALERVTRQLPDLILLDLMMPVMDGFEFLANLRLMDEGRNVPVLVVTAKDLSPEDRERLEAGAQRVLQKSAFDRAALLRQVGSLAGTRQPRGRS
jgi:PAS domain S-box-containing protein